MSELLQTGKMKTINWTGLREFDRIVVNDRFEDAVAALQSMVRAARTGKLARQDRHQTLIAQLLA